MSISCSDCFPDLLCNEDLKTSLNGESQDLASGIESPAFIEESIAVFVEEERNYAPGIDYFERIQSRSIDASAREESVSWILKVQAYYGFQPLTAYLSVNYLDRFLCSRSLPQATGWPLQLLSVACLSLAAKMEEPLVPSLLQLQVEGAKCIFDPKAICRMELLVLNVLNWRLRSITPFSFLSFFAYKLDSAGTYSGFLISRATELIRSTMLVASFLEYVPSCIAAATILCAANDLPNFSLVKPANAELWCAGLNKEDILRCYNLLQKHVVDNMRKRTPKVLPQVRVMTRARIRISESPSSSYKRRKLNDSLWVDHGGNSEQEEEE